ncbi:Stk1 family PASTA domain-containing Ser/Thr kinase [Xylocopilactobacillus apis]|uniref:Serine/threonine protein kinase n=1 Tax=Xylocopilactobacillus apis TaxID=2932183 RepID=A0AAU9D1D6_9LACO|nr:Stk1 family PASTA domain-containing Ser/Thr kinase [Xylocopilactobacillus apis]BDR56090.1 serine/threonine protein kinase [Xylocopilactobacillus apis]
MVEIGQIVDERYQIIQEIGNGENSTVYLAHDLILDRKVAIKILIVPLQSGSQKSQHFEEIAAAMSELNDPRIVNIYDIGNDHGNQYIVMEYVSGTNLQEYLQMNFPLSFEEIQRIMEQVLFAVNAAHSMGFIHGDLKLSNILIDDEKNIKVSDFGLSSALKEIGIKPINVTDIYYLAPELLKGGYPSKQSDLYSLGIIFFELLNQSLFLIDGDPNSITVDQMTSIRQKDPQIPQSFENIITIAMASDLNNRYHSAGQMLDDLNTALKSERFNEPKIIFDKPDFLPESSNSKEILEEFPEPEKPLKQKTHWSDQKKIFVIATSVIVFVFLLLTLILLLNHKKSIELTDVTNMTVNEATSALKEQKLVISPKVERVSDKTIKAGHVIKTDPPARTVVKEGSTVRLYVSTGVPKTKIEDYSSQPFSEVSDILRRKGLKVEVEKEYSDKIKEGLIISQSIESGKNVPEGTSITLTVSKGVETFTMDNLIGSSGEDVIDFANRTGLNQIADPPQYSDQYPAGTVMSQQPAYGSKLKKGDSFHVTLSLGPEPKKNLPNDYDTDDSDNSNDSDSKDSDTDSDSKDLVVEDLIGMSLIEANDYASDNGLNVVEDPAKFSDKYEAGQVISQWPSKGAHIKEGDTIHITLSKGSQPSNGTSH